MRGRRSYVNHAADLLSCDRERHKTYVNVTCTKQKTRDTSVIYA